MSTRATSFLFTAILLAMSNRPPCGASARAAIEAPGWRAAAQSEGAEVVETEDPVQTAGAHELERLLQRHQLALRGEDARELSAAISAMVPFDNPELFPIACAALSYKASRTDKAAAKAQAEELGLSGRDELDGLVAERESMVQEPGARLIANFPGQKKTATLLSKAFKDKKLRAAKPKVVAAVISGLGAIGSTKVHKDVFKELRKYGDEAVMRACVRYFGQVRTRDKSVVRLLCSELAAPVPGSVNDANNPPASYWEERWKKWSAIRRDISWALKEITGQLFEPADGNDVGDSRKALEWLKEHGPEHGIR